MIAVGDLLSGRTADARGWEYVSGTVIETGDAGVVIDGITLVGTVRGVYTVLVRDVLTYVHTRAGTGLS